MFQLTVNLLPFKIADERPLLLFDAFPPCNRVCRWKQMNHNPNTDSTIVTNDHSEPRVFFRMVVVKCPPKINIACGEKKEAEPVCIYVTKC